MIIETVEPSVSEKDLLTVEQSDQSNFITIKKKKKNTEYEVNVFLFEREHLDKLLELQRKFYDLADDKSPMKERITGFFKKLSPNV